MCDLKGGSSSKQKEPPPPVPPVKAASPSASATKRVTAQANAKRKSVAATILAGDTGPAETRQKTLLGGG